MSGSRCNLSYHLSSRPQWMIDLKGKTAEIKEGEGVIYTGNPKILKKFVQGYMVQLSQLVTV